MIAGLRNIFGKDNRIAFGTYTTVAAVDSAIPTGLRRVDAVMVSLQDDPGDDPFLVTAAPSATAGCIDVKSWKNTGGTDPTPAAATTFSKKVNWIAIGA